MKKGAICPKSPLNIFTIPFLYLDFFLLSGYSCGKRRDGAVAFGASPITPGYLPKFPVPFYFRGQRAKQPRLRRYVAAAERANAL